MHAVKQVIRPEDNHPCVDAGGRSLEDMIAQLNDAELAVLEDELDFFAFTGVPSKRMLEIMDQAGVLDDGWRLLLGAQEAPVVPKVLDFMPRASHRRGARRHQPFQDLPALPEIA